MTTTTTGPKTKTDVGKRKKTSSEPLLQRNDSSHWLTVRGARQNNLKNVDVHFPLGRFICVTGVSGSGKSSLVIDILREELSRQLNGAENVSPGLHETIDGLEHLDKVIDIDQKPIGRTPRSNPGTYIKVFDLIRDLYASMPDAKVRGYKPGRFSFNVPSGTGGGGRCEACEGNGANRVDMEFLADIWVPCPVCGGHRFNHETLQIRFRGKNIAEVLEMDVQEALEHFANIPRIAAMLRTLHDVGLDYVKLGQSSTTLSGGEAQRIKLAKELVRKSTGRTLYLLDEPTTGLHFEDIRRLLEVLHGFVDSGNTVVVIEHNLDVIKTADWVIDLGPEGGETGGYVVVEGTPEEVAGCKQSYTGQALGEVLHKEPRASAGAEQLSGKATSKKTASARAKARGSSRANHSTNGELTEVTVVGAAQHNLKDLDVSFPRGRMTVCSGVSGSGKSSFALDTVYAEGQRRYVESLSSYARQFLGQVAKPKVERVEGLSPAISIEQKTTSRSPRSTVGTVTEVFDYMRVLWARLATPYCPKCDRPIGTQTCDEIVERILALPDGTRALLLAPIEPAGNESYEDLLKRQKANGFARVRVDGQVCELNSVPQLDRRSRHSVEVVVDRIVIRANQRSRITDSTELALSLGNGWMTLAPVESASDRREESAASGELKVENGDTANSSGSVTPKTSAVSTLRSPLSTSQDLRFSQRRSCTQCGTSYEELTPHHFSFNTRLGWCATCEGLGVQQGASPDLIVPHPKKPIRGGAIAGWERFDDNPVLNVMMTAVTDHLGFSLDTRWCDLPEEARRGILYGSAGHWYEAVFPASSSASGEPTRKGEPARPRSGGPRTTTGPSSRLRFQWKGFYPAIDEATRSSWQYRSRLSHLTTEIPCQGCSGGRLRDESAAARLEGKTIVEVSRMPLDQALAFFRKLELDSRQRKIAGELLTEIVNRLKFLVDVGLEYVSLNRSAPTLSGGESQRIRLASQIGSGLTGVLYVLDEPTIGLHPRDTRRLLDALAHLRDLGNTLLMVEHDREVIAAADHVLDFGPGAGTDGGRIVAAAAPTKLKRAKDSLTGRYLAGKEIIPVPEERRAGNGNALEILGARHNNLKNIDVKIPLGCFIVVTGVSGSGKSSLVNDVLYNALAKRIHRAGLEAGGHDEIRGIEFIDKVINVDQSPIGNSPSSNPATYTGVFDLIRELFARLPEAKVRGYNVNRFSFNRPGGRCEACEGNGQRCIEMHFLPDVWVTCETCGGARYKSETLEVKYKNKSIADVLEMRISEALQLFENQPKVRRMLQTLADVGLGYLSLGQPAPTLSGGEAQRVKLAAELGRPSTGKTLYILDEPTTGLHFDDLRKLLEVLHRFCDLGNSVICIEHNLDVIKTADHLIDLGPEGGIGGGEIVAEGTPEQVAANPRSHTGKVIAEILKKEPKAKREVFDPAANEQAEQARFDQDDLGQARMPWEIDGRAWHTRDRVAHRGEACKWEGAALEWLIAEIEKAGGRRLAPTDYNSRSTVEIKMPGSETPWFFHARTGNTWLLDASFRVPVRAFSAAEVRKLIPLKTLDECDDLPIYGREPRVTVRHSGRLTDDIRIMINNKQEIATAGAREFIKRAVKAYQRLVRKLAEDVAVRQPWRVTGRAWHLGQQMIAKRDQILWRGTLIAEILGRIKKVDPAVTEDWTRKVMVTLSHPAVPGIWARLITNHPHAMRLEFRCRRGQFTPALIEKLGLEAKIRQMRGPEDQIQFWLQNSAQCDPTQFESLVRESLRSLSGGV